VPVWPAELPVLPMLLPVWPAVLPLAPVPLVPEVPLCPVLLWVPLGRVVPLVACEDCACEASEANSAATADTPSSPFKILSLSISISRCGYIKKQRYQ
jgi:hypothetical protein